MLYNYNYIKLYNDTISGIKWANYVYIYIYIYILNWECSAPRPLFKSPTNTGEVESQILEGAFANARRFVFVLLLLIGLRRCSPGFTDLYVCPRICCPRLSLCILECCVIVFWLGGWVGCPYWQIYIYIYIHKCIERERERYNVYIYI